MSEQVVSRLDEEHAPAHLSGRSFTLCLLLLLIVFTCLNPIWRSENMDAWNENIWWSYIPIPFLVWLFLRIERKWSIGAFVLDTMKLTFVKFVITIVAANILWSVWGVPGTGYSSNAQLSNAAGDATFEPQAAPAPTALDPLLLGELVGEVRNSRGLPQADALVWIARGLESFVFAPPADALRLENRGQGIVPRLSVAQTYTSVNLRSYGSELHTIVISDRDGLTLLNYPVLTERDRELMFKRDYGLLTMRCSVHGAAEGQSHVLVTATPYHTRTDSEGKFRLSGLPAGELQLRSLTNDLQSHNVPVSVRAGEESSVQVFVRDELPRGR